MMIHDHKMNDYFDSVKTVFIGGCPRSGTTMLGSMLGASSNCVVTPESDFKQTIPAMSGVEWNRGISRDDFMSALNKSFRFKIWDIPVPELNLPIMLKPLDYRRALLSIVNGYANADGKKDWLFWIDHTPQNIQDPLMLMTIFPEAKFIHIVRDPRAVAASILPLDWGPDTARQAAVFWAQMLSYGQALECVYADKCFRVYYEDIVISPEKTIRKVCEFCGIEFEDTMLSGGGFRLPAYTKKQHKLVGSRPDQSRLDAWQKTLDIWQIAQIEDVIGDLMELMGYKKFSVGKLPRRPLIKRFVQKVMPFVTYLKRMRYYCRRTFMVSLR